MTRAALIVVLGLATAARADEASEARSARAAKELPKAMQQLKDTTAATAKAMHVKTRGDGCDGDRVGLAGMSQEARSLKLDLSSCRAMSGQERKDCEQPLRDEFKKDQAERAQMMAELRQHISCCEHPKKKGCEEFTPLPAGM